MNINENRKNVGAELATGIAPTRWALAVFASRESLDLLLQTLVAAQIGTNGTAVIDVLVNGNPPLAVALTDHLANPEFSHQALPIRVWDITLGDKANAWNQYIHHIWSGESIAFFIDGYVRLNPNSIKLLGEAIEDEAEVLGGTGVPNGAIISSVAHAHVPQSGFHGNFCCIKGAALEQLRRRKIFLPIGLYRVDALMGALLTLDLDPVNNAWDASRIYVHPAASWQTDPKRWWRMRDIRAQVKRIVRQSRGVLENLAIRDHLRVRKQPPELMLQTAAELILDWVQRCPSQANKVLRYNPLARRALAEIRQSANQTKGNGNMAPVLMGCFTRTRGLVNYNATNTAND